MSAPATKKPRIFITGGSGFIGSVIVELAIAEGYEVHGLSRTEKSDAKLKSLGAVPVRGDLSSFDVLRNESAQAQVVLHLASDLMNNVGMSYEEVLRIDAAAIGAIGEALQDTTTKLVTTSGSLFATPDPNGLETDESSPLNRDYPIIGRREQQSLQLCEKGVQVCAVRLAPYVYGRGGSGIKLFMNMSASSGEVMCVNGGEAYTSAVHVDDAARLYLLVAKKGKSGGVFNATSSAYIKQRQIADAVGSLLDLRVHSISYEEAVSKVGELFAKFLCAENRASSAKAFKEFGWQAREVALLEDMATGLYQEVVEELRNDIV